MKGGARFCFGPSSQDLGKLKFPVILGIRNHPTSFPGQDRIPVPSRPGKLVGIAHLTGRCFYMNGLGSGGGWARAVSNLYHALGRRNLNWVHPE